MLPRKRPCRALLVSAHDAHNVGPATSRQTVNSEEYPWRAWARLQLDLCFAPKPSSNAPSFRDKEVATFADGVDQCNIQMW